MICKICSSEGFRESLIEPAEPCICGHICIWSPYQYAGIKGMIAYTKYTILRKSWEWLMDNVMTNKFTNSLYKEWKY